MDCLLMYLESNVIVALKLNIFYLDGRTGQPLIVRLVVWWSAAVDVSLSKTPSVKNCNFFNKKKQKKKTEHYKHLMYELCYYCVHGN